MADGQFVVTGASKAEIAKIRRRLQFLSSTLASSLFKGSYPSEDALVAEKGQPKEGWNYYNTSIGQTLTYHKGAWYQYTIDGENGTDSNYEGSFTVAPSDPVTDDAYYDSVDGVVYIYNGVAWEIMSQAGTGISVTYNDSDLDITPTTPTGTGEPPSDPAWHLDATEDVNWLSQKVTVIGIWGTPIPCKNLIGAVGPQGPQGDPGEDAVVYYILPTDGTAIKNSTGTLTIEAHRIVGGVDAILSAGTIELFDPANNPLGYSETFNAASITNDIVITLKDGAGGVPKDTITLVDITDGADGSDGSDGSDGADAIVGSVESDNGLAWVQAAGPGAWSPVTTTSTLTCTFYQSGSPTNTMNTVVTRTDGNLGATGATVDGITSVVTGNGTPTLTVEFTHNASGNTVSETMYAVSGGDDGADGADGADGTDGTDGSIVPILSSVDFQSENPSGSAVSWSQGTINFGTTEIAMSAGGNTTLKYIYWVGPSATTLSATNTLATATATGNWLVCINDSGTAYPAQATRLINAGMIVVNTLAAIQADLGTITGGSITLSGLNGSEVSAATARYQMRMNGSGIQGRWRASGDPTAWGAWKNVVDISGNEVKVSFDSFATGETIPGIGATQVAGSDVVFGGQANAWSRTITTRTGPVVLNSTYFKSSDFAVEHVDQGPVTVDAHIDANNASDLYECTLNVHRVSDDTLIGSTTSNQQIVNIGDAGSEVQFNWTDVSGKSFLDIGADLEEEIYVVVAMENVSVGVFSITFGDSLNNEIKIDNVGVGTLIVKT